MTKNTNEVYMTGICKKKVMVLYIQINGDNITSVDCHMNTQ